MVATEPYDILILGGGKAGKTLAMDQAKAGRRVALIEAGMIGGSCINVACIPSKTLIRSAERMALVEDAPAFGVEAKAPVANMANAAARTASVVAGMVEANRNAFAASGLELVMGWGRFVAPRIIEVACGVMRRRLTAPAIYLNLGTRAAIPPIEGLAAAGPLTHVEALVLETLPRVLLILGGGYIGMEMAQAFRRLGSEVLLIEAGPRLAAREDDDVTQAIASLFADEGIRVITHAEVAYVHGRSGDLVRVQTTDGRRFEGTHLLVAAGRRPMTSDIGLDTAGVDLGETGFVKVDDQLRTSAPGIWALGEAAGTAMFTHAALDDFRIAKSRIEGGDRVATDRLIPTCLFIDPEFARVGLSENEARHLGTAFRVATLPMDAVPRARTMSARRGFMKCLVSGIDDSILGFAMIGERAGEVMAVVQLAMLGNLPYTLLRDAIWAHPTIAEGFNLLFARMPPRS